MRPFHTRRFSRTVSDLQEKGARFSRLRLCLTRFAEFLLLRPVLYWGLAAVFILACLGPLMTFLFTKVYPSPTVLWPLLAGLTGLPVLMGLIYMLRPLPPSPGWFFTQQPLSDLAEAEVIMVDTALLTGNRRCVSQAAQPFEPADVKKGPGMLSLAAAITYTADRYDAPEADALLRAADALGLNRGNLLRFRPLEGETRLGSLSGVVVRDGKRRMAYFTGGTGDLLEVCGGVLDGTIRPLTDADRQRIHHTMLDMSQRGCRVVAYACSDDTSAVSAPIFLGMAALQDDVYDASLEAIDALQQEGISLLIQPVSPNALPPYSLAGLRQRLRCTDEPYNPQIVFSAEALDTRIPCISPVDDRHHGFHDPILLAREWFSDMEIWLRAAVTFALPMLLACAAGPTDPLWCLAVIALLTPALATMSSRCRPRLRCMLLPLITATLLRLFLAATMPDSAPGAMALFAFSASLIWGIGQCGKWQAVLLTLGLFLLFALLVLIPPHVGSIPAAFALVAGTVVGLLSNRSMKL